jgi:hypothetical protein
VIGISISPEAFAAIAASDLGRLTPRQGAPETKRKASFNVAAIGVCDPVIVGHDWTIAEA